MEDPVKKSDKPTRLDFYANFIDKLQNPKSSKLKDKFVTFIKDIQNDRREILDLISAVVNFRDQFEYEFQDIWNETEELEELNGEAIEGLIAKNLYDKLISLYSFEKDKRLAKYFEVFEFIEPKHLEIPDGIIIESTLEHAAEQIHKIQKFKTPRDKIICIINCCKILSGMIAHASKNAEKCTGADDFLPALIFAVIKAKPQNIACDISYIRDFRSQIRLKGLEEYYFTAFESSLEFIYNIDPTKLKIEPQEYARLCEEGLRKYEDNQKSLEFQQNTPQPPRNEGLSSISEKSTEDNKEQNDIKPVIETVESVKEGFQDIVKKLLSVKEASNFDPKSKKFYGIAANNLKIGEIPELVTDYNNMINQHKELCKKLEEIAQMIEDKSMNKKSDKNKLLGLFRFA